jgi:general secretion pathway protein I
MRNSAGFTLLEVMVAVAIMATVLVTLLGLKNSTMQDVAFAEHMTAATMLAKRMMTETVGMKKSILLGEAEGDFSTEGAFKEYTWKRSATQIPLMPTLIITEVRVAVLWTEGNRQESVELVSYE